MGDIEGDGKLVTSNSKAVDVGEGVDELVVVDQSIAGDGSEQGGNSISAISR